MNQPDKKTVLIAAAVVAIIGIVLFWSYRSNPAPVPANQENPGSNQNTTPTPSPTQGESQNPNPAPSGTSTGSKGTVTINLLSPQGGERWIVNKSHSIQWDKKTGATGGIYLVDASDGSTVGWITSQTAATQTSYAWDTRQVFISRNSPNKKDIVAGKQYIIKVRFDLPGNPELSSGAIQIIYPEQIVPQTYIISVKNLAFSPSVLIIVKGDSVVFKNDDLTVTYNIQAVGAFGPYNLAPGQSAIVKTDALTAGEHPYIDTLHSNLTGTIIVQ